MIDAINLKLDGPSDDPDVKDGMSADGQGLIAIPQAFTELWTQMSAAPATFFATATTITPPPTLALIAVDLIAIIPANLPYNGSGIPPSTGDPDQDQEIAITNLVLGFPLATNGFHLRNQGGTWTPPSGPPVVIV